MVLKDHLVPSPPPLAGVTPTRPGCSRQLIWPRALQGLGQPQPPFPGWFSFSGYPAGISAGLLRWGSRLSTALPPNE